MASRLNPSVTERFGDRLRAFARPWEVASFIWLPLIVLGYTVWYELHTHRVLEDFRIFRIAATAVIHGHTPYVAADPHALAHFDKFVYPPSTAFFFSPFAVMPLPVAQVIMFVLSLACTFAALRLLGVQDWRCYGVTVMSPTIVNSLALGAVTPFLLVGAAAVWRYRDRPVAAGCLAAITGITKLFLWPLGLWLLVTRRLRGAAVCVAVAVGVLLAGWAVIGFAGFRGYPHLLSVLTRVEQHASYSPLAFAHLGQAATGAVSLALFVLLALCVVVSARGADGDRRSLAIAIAGALVATPLVWLHYLALLLVPIAVYRPRLSGLWFVPLALWLTPASHANGSSWRIALALGVIAVVVARTVAESQTQGLIAWGSRLPRVSAGQPQSLAGTE
jgi:alpha-1,2-mannosyltransferase